MDIVALGRCGAAHPYGSRMPTHHTGTKRRTTKAAGSPQRTSHEPAPRIVHSSETGRSYTLDRLIGKGGVGEVYLATPSGGAALPAQVCIKISDRMSGWLREAYFAELLMREDRALRVLDRFVEA